MQGNTPGEEVYENCKTFGYNQFKKASIFIWEYLRIMEE
jgi:hypothetical protein